MGARGPLRAEAGVQDIGLAGWAQRQGFSFSRRALAAGLAAAWWEVHTC